MKSAMSRAVSNMRSGYVKEVQKKYDISGANLRTDKNIKCRYSYASGSVTATVTFAGKKISLYRYNGTTPKIPKYDTRRRVPVVIKNRCPKLASYILSQYGGPDGELGAALRYLSQRFSQTDKRAIAILTDIGTEELSHLEMIGSIVSQLTTGEGAKSFDRYGVGAYYMDHANAVYPANAGGVPFTAAYIQSKADPLADLHEDLAAEQKARATYDNILRVCDDPDVSNVIRFLREREVVHFQRFGEILDILQDQIK